MKGLFERGYPYLAAIIAAVVLQRVADGVMCDDNFGEVLNGLVTFDSIVIGFFGAIIPVVLSMKNESKVVKYLFENDREGLFSKYLKITIFSGISSAVLSLALHVRNCFIHLFVKDVLYTLWVFFTVLFLFSTYRSLSYMILLMFSKDDSGEEGKKTTSREKTKLEKDLEEKYK